MGDLNPFKKPKQDTSALKKQEELLAKQEADMAAEELAQKKQTAASNKARRGGTGKNSLLAGLETGVAPDKRASLG
jgi:uncharacterized protein YmfQ (DUF2313 family)